VNPKVRSELSIPLIYRNEVLGVLNVESTRTNAYTENDEEMLGTLAGSLAAIIAHSRLLEQFRQQVERERLLYDITSKIRRTSSPEKILSIAANELSKVLNTRRTEIEVTVQSEPNREAIRNSIK
jgi:sigma-B regulation protein RsbU (phosphoserine phosphatase)